MNNKAILINPKNAGINISGVKQDLQGVVSIKINDIQPLIEQEQGYGMSVSSYQPTNEFLEIEIGTMYQSPLGNTLKQMAESEVGLTSGQLQARSINFYGQVEGVGKNGVTSLYNFVVNQVALPTIFSDKSSGKEDTQHVFKLKGYCPASARFMEFAI